MIRDRTAPLPPPSPPGIGGGSEGSEGSEDSEGSEGNEGHEGSGKEGGTADGIMVSYSDSVIGCFNLRNWIKSWLKRRD